MRFFFTIFFVSFIFGGSLLGTEWSEQKLEQEISSIAHELRCPVCQGLSVKESMNDISMNMKNKIKTLLLEGKSRQEIFTYFEQRYGEWILRNPKKTGLNVSLWLLPLGSIFFVGAFLFWNLKRKYQNFQ